MEPHAEELKTTSQRQAWCDSVLSVKIPVEEMIGKRTTEDKTRFGEKTESMLRQCRYFVEFNFFMSFLCFRVSHFTLLLLRFNFRSMWQRLSAVRLLIEHVYPSQDSTDSIDLRSILKLWKVTDTFQLGFLTVINLQTLRDY